jgi:hypothetical protein
MIGPAIIGVPKKSRNSPSDISRSILKASEAAFGIDVPMPVFHEGRPVAVVRGYQGKPYVDAYIPEAYVPRWCAFNSYSDIKDAYAAGRTHVTRIIKSATTGGVANNYYDMWPVGGNPACGTYPGVALTSVQWNDDVASAIRHGGNVSTSKKHLIRFEGISSNNAAQVIILYDRVLTYEACSITGGNQVFVNSLAAQRYISGGEPGLKIMITGQTLLGASATNYTQLQYTDNEGNTLQSMPVAFGVNVIVSAAAPTATLGARVVSPAVSGGTLTFGPFMPLATGDTGVRLLDNVTSSGANTGTLAYVLCYPIALIPLSANITTIADQVMQLTSLGHIKDGACLSELVFFAGAATGATYTSQIDTVWG